MNQADFSFMNSPESSEKPTSKPLAEPSASASKEINFRILNVTQLTRLIKLALAKHLPAKIVVSGEISNFKKPASGHLYLTLKDDNAQIPAVMWRSGATRLKFSPADGMQVIATGRVDLYEPQGKVQFYIDKLEPAGLGALELAFRQLAEKLRNEGLFDEQHKKPLPPYPRTIAIVTSSTGAAVKDIVNTLNRRFGIVRKLLYPVTVQGETAAAEITAAINTLNRRCDKLGGIDLVIVARGGGSIEDLWAFNEEIVARAIFASKIPVITGIGHEIDTTIADMVADKRTATPTAAAEQAVPVLSEILQNLARARQRLDNSIQNRCQAAKQTCKNLALRPVFLRPLDLINQRSQFLDERQSLLTENLTNLLHHAEKTLSSYTAVLRRIEPHAALGRGHNRVTECRHLLLLARREYLSSQKHRLDQLAVTLRSASPITAARQQRLVLSHLAGRIDKIQQQHIWRCRQTLNASDQRLKNLNPRTVLGRGYSITRTAKTNQIVTGESKIKAGDILVTELDKKIFVESQVCKNV